jgi:glycosyltransferase involved in cell wall biosynthesis
LDDDNRARVRTLPFGVDPVKFAPPSPEEEPRTPTILFLANLWRRKGIFTLLDAFCIVHSVLPDARLVIAGDGSDAEEIRAQAAAHPAAQHIEMIGMVPRSRVPDILRTCSVYCLPSFGEPFGMSALEAMSCGRPFVGTDAGGLRHIVSPDGGILVPVGNPDALAGALLRILTEPGLAAHMGKENVRHVKGNFAWDTVIDRLEDLYAELAPVGRVPQESAKVASRQMPMAAKSLPLRP